MTKVITVTPNPAIDLTIYAANWARGLVNRGQEMFVTPGGKGLTVALILAEAGVHSCVTGWMGRDNDDTFRRAFKEHEIVDDFIRYDGNVRRNVKIVDNNNGETTDINMTGHCIPEAARKELVDYLDREVNEDSVLVFGGSVPPGINETFYADMAARYRNKCHYLVIDTSDKPLAQMMQADILPHVIKPNIHELRTLVGKKISDETEIIQNAREFVERGVELAVISAGHKGAWFVSRNEAIHAMPPKVKVASTVGAGDAMVAGIVRGLMLGRALSDIARTATAYSAATIRQVGTSLPSHNEIEHLRQRVEIREIG